MACDEYGFSVPRAARAVVEAKPEPEQQTEHEIKVREVTDYQVAWTERERGAPGAITIQLILDRGVDEYVVRPTAEDAQLIVALMTGPGRVHFDLDRKVLMFGTSPSARRRSARLDRGPRSRQAPAAITTKAPRARQPDCRRSSRQRSASHLVPLSGLMMANERPVR